MRFTIVTPSFRQSQWLRLCVASIADQRGVEVEHIVQDACSDDGTADWLPKDPRVKAFIEKDRGMYDAVNRGFQRGSGDLLAYLNCDEQYLPGALQRVADYFERHPETDVVFGDVIVTDSAGEYLCSRYALVPRRSSMWVRFPILTCSLFIRRRVIHEKKILFDTQWRDLGDFFWVKEMVDQGLRLAVLPELTSTFADTGENMNLKPNAIREKQIHWSRAPRWVKLMKIPFVLSYRLRLTLRPPWRVAPFDYSIYTMTSPERRVNLRAAHPTSFWKGRRGS